MNKILIRPLVIALAILSIPFIAMQVTTEMNWGLFDFVGMGGLIFVTVLAYELLTRNTVVVERKIIVGMVLAALLFLVWVQLAVGIWD
jgi:hypothetical protein